VISVPWPRNERSAIAGAKSTSYAENVVCVQDAQAKGASEALMANLAGALCEGTGSNVAVAVGDELLTPPLSSGCLAGITRELLLEWAQAEGLAVVERDLPFDVLASAEDVVLLSSTRDVQRVHEIDGRLLTGGALGDAAMALFDRRSAENRQP
jgi:branched-chain amino acid aminotransferase